MPATRRGATYTPSDLIDPVSVVSGTTPVQRESEHIFFKLGDFEAMLRKWTRSGSLQSSDLHPEFGDLHGQLFVLAGSVRRCVLRKRFGRGGLRKSSPASQKQEDRNTEYGGYTREHFASLRHDT